MGHREFTDSIGRHWDVWAVFPEGTERRDPENGQPAPAVERCERETFRVPLAGRWRRGWLAFETKFEKRRLAPIPAGWLDVADDELERLCDQAITAPTPPRRLIE